MKSFVILCVITLMLYSCVGYNKKHQERETKATMNEIANALKLYQLKKGSYPTTNEGLRLLVQENILRHYKDLWGNKINYKYDVKVILWSNGPDGHSGTSDDIYP
jgi:type II secretory pathway pseudopilin PulG